MVARRHAGKLGDIIGRQRRAYRTLKDRYEALCVEFDALYGRKNGELLKGSVIRIPKLRLPDEKEASRV